MEPLYRGLDMSTRILVLPILATILYASFIGLTDTHDAFILVRRYRSIILIILVKVC